MTDTQSLFTSRMLTFVFAGALTTLLVLIGTFIMMNPLTKTQIFFMGTAPADSQRVLIQSYFPNKYNLETFKENFIKQYIAAREEISANRTTMGSRWNPDGPVAMMSTKNVYSEFTKTPTYQIGINNEMGLRRSIEIMNIEPRSIDTWAVKIRAIDVDNTGQSDQKDFTIQITIAITPPMDTLWGERLNNPLGIYVTGYHYEK